MFVYATSKCVHRAIDMHRLIYVGWSFDSLWLAACLRPALGGNAVSGGNTANDHFLLSMTGNISVEINKGATHYCSTIELTGER
ncbi:hypothetical protein I7I48_07534 [Histoplasma ohiense]|nr:hypothetical protein I7I48_07534 [Histoplasma ohiense (nom. inval.)]